MQNLKEINKDKNIKYLLNLLGFEINEIIDSIKELKYELNEEDNRDEKRTDKLINDDIIFEEKKLQALKDLKNISVIAKKYYGVSENGNSNVGAFSNFAQNDQKLYPLHTYLMYLKFGFGRANQDASIEVRRGAMKRSQAVQLVKLYDNSYPEEFVTDYLDYYKISKKKFDKIIDKWANKKLFEKKNNRWIPKFEIF